jgi:hypothetical protein
VYLNAEADKEEDDTVDKDDNNGLGDVDPEVADDNDGDDNDDDDDDTVDIEEASAAFFDVNTDGAEYADVDNADGDGEADGDKDALDEEYSEEESGFELLE